MNAPQRLHELGQSLWLDNITRDLLTRGTLARYIRELGVTGLTSNPSIYDKAIAGSSSYDDDITRCAARGLSPEDTFFELALADLRRAAEHFGPVHELTGGVDGFVSLEVSPLLAYDPATTVREALRLHDLGGRPNLFIKIPGTAEGLPAVEEAIFAGVPVNVTLLFSPAHYLACMEAYTRGIERRVAAGRPAAVASVASVFVSRWDAAANSDLPAELRNRLGLLIGRRSYTEYRRFFATDRWQRLLNSGARPQRLLFASTGTKDPSLPEDLYVAGLAAPHTVNTMPEETLLAYADHGRLDGPLAAGLDDDKELLAAIQAAGVDVDAVAATLQAKGAAAFVASWNAMLARIATKAAPAVA
ncbi:MAG: transaldolase [Chloroflexota bacterium]|nr:MAG: transaldolase [Chloroflexota bacterium]